MRFSPLAIVVSLTLATVSSSVYGQRTDDDINSRSVALVEEGRTALAAGETERALGLVESALAVDPRNRDGFVALAEVARARDLPGLAIRYYREALSMEPNDLAALEGQGEVLVERGAVVRARQNLARIETICETACPPATSLSAAIAEGPPARQLAVQENVTPAAGEASEQNTP